MNRATLNTTTHWSVIQQFNLDLKSNIQFKKN